MENRRAAGRAGTGDVPAADQSGNGFTTLRRYVRKVNEVGGGK